MRRDLPLGASLLLLLFGMGAGPCAIIPGGALDGEVVAEPADWSAHGPLFPCDVEVRPEEPHSVRANCMQSEGKLYVGAMTAARKEWPQLVASDPRVRVRVAGRIHEFKLVRVVDPAERSQVLSTPEERAPATTWPWRLEPR